MRHPPLLTRYDELNVVVLRRLNLLYAWHMSVFYCDILQGPGKHHDLRCGVLTCSLRQTVQHPRGLVAPGHQPDGPWF